MAVYPSRVDYIAAINDYHNSVLARKLKGGQPVRVGWNLTTYSGGFALVCPIRINQDTYGLRCFLRPPTGIKTRYDALQKQLSQNGLPYFVESGYVDEGIVVNNGRYPISFIRWVEGETLENFLDRNIGNQRKIVQTANSFEKMVRELHKHKISHGDLQHRNIMVSDSGDTVSLTLIDYDSVAVMGITSAPPTTGLPEYQHPLRFKGAQFNTHEKIDYFSELVIYLSLQAYAKRPDLWHNKKSDGLLFQVQDFSPPNATPIFQELETLSPEIRRLVSWLRKFCVEKDVNRLESLETCLNSEPRTIDSFEAVFGNSPQQSTQKKPKASGRTTKQAKTRKSGTTEPTEDTPFEAVFGKSPERSTQKKPKASGSTIPKTRTQSGTSEPIGATWVQLFPSSRQQSPQPQKPSAPAAQPISSPSSVKPSHPVSTVPSPQPQTSSGNGMGCFLLGTILAVLVIVFVLTGTVKSTKLNSNSGWYDTTLDVNAHSRVCVFGFGKWTVDSINYNKVGPEGYDRDTDLQISSGAIPDCRLLDSAPYGALIGMIGGKVFLIGGPTCFEAPSEGILFLSINDAPLCQADNEGDMSVIVFTHLLF